MSVQHQQIVDGYKQQIEDLKIEVELKGTMMKGEHSKLEEQIKNLNGEVRKVREQSEQDKENLQIALAEKQSLEETHSKVDNKYREKEALLEKALVQKSDFEDQLQKSRASYEHVQLESTELQLQITRANEEIAAWKGDCQAKTQQVKQYSKQVEQFRFQVDSLTAELRDSRAKIAEYEHQLRFFREQVRQLDENEEQKVRLTRMHAYLYNIKSTCIRYPYIFDLAPKCPNTYSFKSIGTMLYHTAICLSKNHNTVDPSITNTMHWDQRCCPL